MALLFTVGFLTQEEINGRDSAECKRIPVLKANLK